MTTINTKTHSTTLNLTGIDREKVARTIYTATVMSPEEPLWDDDEGWSEDWTQYYSKEKYRQQADAVIDLITPEEPPVIHPNWFRPFKAEPERECEWCGKPFVVADRRQIYCRTIECDRERAREAKRAEKRMRELEEEQHEQSQPA